MVQLYDRVEKIERKKILRSSETNEVLMTEQIINYVHIKLQKIQMCFTKKKRHRKRAEKVITN